MEDSFHIGAKALISNDDGKLLLLKRPSGIWDLPGGRIQRGETLEQTLRREILEETGLELLSSIPLLTALTSIRIPQQGHDTVGLVFSIYHCTAAGTIRLSPEHTEFAWFTSQDAAQVLPRSYPPSLIELLERNQLNQSALRYN